jgi:LysM repeat protein
VDELIKSNPGCESGLKVGQTLNVPAKNQPDISATARSANTQTSSEPQSVANDNQKTFSQHIVARGETVYSIANIYDTTVEEIYRLNASARDGIYVGDMLAIPQRQNRAKKRSGKFSVHTISSQRNTLSVSRYYNMRPERSHRP